MSGERGQASVELVVLALALTCAALAVCQLLLLAAARQRALRIADQAAVLAAQGRPLPAGLREEADISTGGGVVRVVVRVPALPGMPAMRVVERTHLP